MCVPTGLVSAIALTAALVTCPPVLAQSAVPSGRLLASNCFQCHGTNGQGPGFEKLAGKSTREIFNELREMKSDNDNDLMARHARGYTNAQLRALSRYLSRQR